MKDASFRLRGLKILVAYPVPVSWRRADIICNDSNVLRRMDWCFIKSWRVLSLNHEDIIELF